MVDRKTIVIVILIVLLCLLISFGTTYVYDSMAKKPFANISKDDIAGVSVIFGAHEPYQLTEDETDVFIDMLRDIIIYKEDNTYLEYSGINTTKKFRIEMTNGQTIDIVASNPHFIINKTGYRTEYLQCDRLSGFYHEIVHEKIIPKSID